MKDFDLGAVSILMSLGAWVIGVTFTLLSWWSVDAAYSDHQAGAPVPDSLSLEIFPLVAALAFPLSVLAFVLGVIAILSYRERAKAVIGIITSLPLIVIMGFGFWVVTNGGV